MNEPMTPGELSAAIANVIVHELTQTAGRGPERAVTTFGQNAIFVVLENSLSRGERNLRNAGENESVLGIRRKWQQIMSTRCIDQIEHLTGRAVIGFMSDSDIVPDQDLAVEVFILAPLDPKAKGLIT